MEQVAPSIYRRDGKRGPVFYCRIQIDGARVTARAGRTLRDAQVKLAELIAQGEKGTLARRSKDAKQTIRTWCEGTYLPHVETSLKAPQRVKAALVNALPALGHIRLDRVTARDLEAFAADRINEGAATATAAREVAVVRAALALAERWRVIHAAPRCRLPRIENARVPVLSPADERELWAACPPWLRRLVRAATWTGARAGELRTLTWGQVDLTAGTAALPTTKNGRPRIVMLPRALVDELRPRVGPPAAPVFPGRRGLIVSAKVLSGAFKDACDRAIRAAAAAGRPQPALSGLHFHDLRHVFATRMLESGAALPEVAEALGHTSLIMSRRYAHTLAPRRRALIEAVPITPDVEPSAAAAAPAAGE